jgi:hypothetical protein
MREGVLKAIQDVVTERARKSGYSLIIDTAAQSKNETPIIMFTNGDSDITDEILKQLNLDAPAEWLKPAADDKSAPAAPAPKPATPPAAPDKKKK